jgi:hypothetical protein
MFGAKKDVSCLKAWDGKYNNYASSNQNYRDLAK